VTTGPLWFALALATACASEHEPALTKRECVPNQFRACHADVCKGVEQCVDPGYWSGCDCVVGDAGFAESGLDADADAPDDVAGDAGDDADAAEAGD
jgi:hypothetical protein